MKKKIISLSRLQDALFLIGIFIFSSVLILGLFPKTRIEEDSGSVFFLFTLMIIPVLVAIYFIIISFQRKLFSEKSEVDSSIRLKIALALIFVAILPSLPIIFVSNYIIDNAISDFISEKTTKAIEDALELSYDYLQENHENLQGELRTLYYTIKNGRINLDSNKNRNYIIKINKLKGYSTGIFKVVKKGPLDNEIYKLDSARSDNYHSSSVIRYLNLINLKHGFYVYSFSIDESDMLLGALYSQNFLIAIYKEIPADITKRISAYQEDIRKYNEEKYSNVYLKTRVRVFLLIFSLILIMFSIIVSLLISRNVTRPVLELVKAAKSVASGNFKIYLNRNSSDELSLLFNSFNRMVKQLDDSRKLVYQTQKLQAWKDVAAKIVHEIKNPLTPIRLSAERIRKRYKEGHPDIDNIVMTGSETIIEEVKVLVRILSEFTRFARMPEMKAEFQSLNPILANCVNLFQGHEDVTIITEFDKSIPDIYIDKILIRQAITNILHNAIDAVKEKGIIHVKSKYIDDVEDNVVRIVIKDNGKGIKQKDLEGIFEPTFSTKAGGTGLGLTIVEKIIIEHYGKISCNSVYGEGAEFIIDLPVILY